MALDKLVDSSALDANLTQIGNAIRYADGTTATLAFPSGMVTSIRALKPTGTKNITLDGTVSVAGYEYAEVNVGATNLNVSGSVTATDDGDANITLTSSGGGGTVSLQSKTKTYTPSETQQSETVTADTGYDGLSSVAVTVDAISSTYVGSGITQRSSSDLTASGATVTVPSGYYGSQATKSVTTGTEGSPTATKGTVSNNSVSVTPSVTNTEGYISGGTKTGTAVTVSASELVSGSQTLTSNDTYDVTNLASVVVDVASSGGATNIVQGTFTTGSTRAGTGTTTIDYTGSGYPIALMVYVDGGAYNNSTGGNTTWYNSVSRYDVGAYYMTKSQIPVTPTYSTSGGANYGCVAIIYKNSTSSSTSYTRTSSMTANAFSSSDGAASTVCCRFKGNNKTLAWYVGNSASSSIGLAPSTTYAYIAVYSS